MNSNTSLRPFCVLTLVALASAAFVTSARAGEFFERDGAALRGYDAVAYVKDGKAVKGSSQYSTQYKGSTFRFDSKANLEAFTAEPTKFAPQYGGYCAFGMASGYKAATDPAAFTVRDGKLYLNYNRDVQKMWSADVPGFVVKADKLWPEVSTQQKVIE